MNFTNVFGFVLFIVFSLQFSSGIYLSTFYRPLYYGFTLVSYSLMVLLIIINSSFILIIMNPSIIPIIDIIVFAEILINYYFF